MARSDLLALGAVGVLSMAHLLAPRLRFLELVPRSWALSAAGGVSVAYVFVHLLPEVAEAQAAVDEAAAAGLLAGLERHAYLAALAGLVVFYGLERAVVATHDPPAQGAAHGKGSAAPGTFWLSVALFAVYDGVVAYLAVGRARSSGVADLALFTVALGLHLLVNDLGLRHHHRRRYDRIGRPTLVGALVAGWIVGLGVEVSDAALGVVVAFLAGGVVLNVIKEEVPAERDSRFLPFACGAAAYAALLLAF